MKLVPFRKYPARMGPTELPTPQTVYVIAEADALSFGVTVPMRYDCWIGQEMFIKKLRVMYRPAANW